MRFGTSWQQLQQPWPSPRSLVAAEPASFLVSPHLTAIKRMMRWSKRVEPWPNQMWSINCDLRNHHNYPQSSLQPPGPAKSRILFTATCALQILQMPTSMPAASAVVLAKSTCHGVEAKGCKRHLNHPKSIHSVQRSWSQICRVSALLNYSKLKTMYSSGCGSDFLVSGIC